MYLALVIVLISEIFGLIDSVVIIIKAMPQRECLPGTHIIKTRSTQTTKNPVVCIVLLYLD